MQNLSIHTKTSSGYSGECPGRLGDGGKGSQEVRVPEMLCSKAINRDKGKGESPYSWQRCRGLETD